MGENKMNRKGMIAEGVEDITRLTLENLLMEKFRVLQLCREEGDADVFDSVSQSIEILLKASPYAYADLMKIKQEMQKELEEEYKNIESDANKTQDEIYRKHLIDSRVEEAEWIYRITYEEVLVEIFQKNQLIASLIYDEPTDVQDVDVIQEYEEEQPQEEQEPQEELTIDAPEKRKNKKRIKVRRPKLMRQQD